MKLLKDENTILISVKEFVTAARRKISPSLPLDENEPSLHGADKILKDRLGLGAPAELSFDFCRGDRNFRLFGRADSIQDNVITLVKYSTASTSAQKKAEAAQARGEGFVLAKMYAGSEKTDALSLRIIYINEASGEKDEHTEVLDTGAVSTFFKKCITAVDTYAQPEIERVCERLPSFEKVKFPYSDIRSGQEEFIKKTYRAISRGGTLFASAPTGTGKTVSVIYPAIKALAKDKCDKVFYLTPKTTTAEAVRDCVDLLAKSGARIRAIILTSKEKACTRHMVCRESLGLCELIGGNRLSDAVLAVFKLNKDVIDISDIKSIANAYTVCPYELELAYSELCDLVICDFNYLFDPAVYIRRFFTEGGRFAFLIDEAHNLADRAREMYSAELSMADIDSLLSSEYIGAVSSLRTELPKIKSEYLTSLFPYIKDETVTHDGRAEGAVHLSYVPSAVFALTERLEDVLYNEAESGKRTSDSERTARLTVIRDLLYKVKKFSQALNSFNTGYRLFMFYRNECLSLKVFCIDTGTELEKRLCKGSSAVFFSATLSPIDYYKSVLSGTQGAEILTVDSPFDTYQLSVSIMDRISTRSSEREKTLPAITRTIAATMSAKRGHYMVFTPSFEYAKSIHDHFSEKYPKIKCMLQSKDMTAEERLSFIGEFSRNTDDYLLGFCVMGGIYAEGIDLAGDTLIGAIVVGIGMPSLSYEREAIADYFEEKYESGKQFAYIYPGMNRVFQAAGRVIRRESDRGIIVLIDDRFADPIYKKSIPTLWSRMRYVSDVNELNQRLKDFWNGIQ